MQDRLKSRIGGVGVAVEKVMEAEDCVDVEGRYWRAVDEALPFSQYVTSVTCSHTSICQHAFITYSARDDDDYYKIIISCSSLI
jgi:hypothetical protein